MHWFDLVKIFPSKQPYHAGWIPSGKSRDDVVVVNRRTHRRYKCFVFVFFFFFFFFLYALLA
jgi:hypothetical protein